MKKRLLPLLSAALAASMMLTACGPKTPPPAESTPPASSPEAVESATPVAETRLITDMAGRQVEIPAQVNTAYASSAISQYFLYAIAPEKMIGWSFVHKTAQPFIPEEYRNLPLLGGTSGSSQLNPEVIAKAAPDIIISLGPDKVSQNTIDTADNLQKQLNIPVVVMESSARTIDKALDFLGDVLGKTEVSDKLSAYAREVIGMVETNSAKLTEEEKIRIYYAEGEDGFQTEPQTSPHAIVLDMVGCRNVAQVEEGMGTGKVSVSPEQVLSWNPDLIIVSPSPLENDPASLYNKFSSDDKGIWADITAVQNGAFYEVPLGPINWMDRPPSVNQILGLLWAGKLLYPELYDYDLKEEAKEFFDLFYHYNLSDEEFERLTARSLR